MALRSFVGGGSVPLGPLFEDSNNLNDAVKREELARAALSVGDVTTDQLDALVSDINTAVITAEKANVRSKASLKSEVVTSAEMGEIYKVLGKKGDWVQLGYYDNSSPLGWIRHDLVFGE